MLPFWKILGWMLYVSLYFVAAEGVKRWPEEHYSSVIFKVLPVFQCLLIVLSSKSIEDEFPSVQKNMALGFIFSMVGDAILIYEDYKMYGGIAFAIAHINYVQALGVAPFGGGPIFASFVVIGGSIVYYLLPHISGVEGAVTVGYLVLLLIVAWRATVRYVISSTTINLCACIGALLFVVSDAVLLSDFWVQKWEYAPPVVMSTYYLAQLGLSMAATNDFIPTGYETKLKED